MSGQGIGLVRSVAVRLSWAATALGLFAVVLYLALDYHYFSEQVLLLVLKVASFSAWWTLGMAFLALLIDIVSPGLHERFSFLVVFSVIVTSLLSAALIAFSSLVRVASGGLSL